MYFKQARNHGPSTNFPIQRVILHGTVSPCRPGQARATAAMFATTTRDASTQYVADPGEIVQCVKDDVVAYGAPPNEGSIHIEQCDPQAGAGSRWQDADHQAMLHLVAQLVAGLCTKYKIPVVKLSAADLRAGHRGIAGHKDVSDAFHQTDHVDPGPDYPWGQVLALVKAYQHPMKKVKMATVTGAFSTPYTLTAGKPHEVQTHDGGPSLLGAATDLRATGIVGFHVDTKQTLLARVYTVKPVGKDWQEAHSNGWEPFDADKAGFVRYSVGIDVPKGYRLRAGVQAADAGVVNEVWFDLETEAK